MIHILDKQKCCGCAACVQRCPKHCISLREDEEGFLYPEVEGTLCINCGLCEMVCPEIHQEKKKEPLAVYAAKNKDEHVRMSSSSGGIFSALAESVLRQGGLVFGACFDDSWEVVHHYAEDLENTLAFRGSKYVQSKIGNSFLKVESFLKAGRLVLFSGTPCQIAGLKSFLRKEYDNLLTIDVICHGVPSPGIWRKYLDEEIVRQCSRNSLFPSGHFPTKNIFVDEISFRNKNSGWKEYGFFLVFSSVDGNGDKHSFSLSTPYMENPFMKGFLADLFLRPSCYACPFKSGRSGSDITLGDFWGIQNVMPSLDDDKGVSAVLVNTESGEKWINTLGVDFWATEYEKVVAYNPALQQSANYSNRRVDFYAMSGLSIKERVERCTRMPLKSRVKQRLRQMIGLFGGKLSK